MLALTFPNSTEVTLGEVSKEFWEKYLSGEINTEIDLLNPESISEIVNKESSYYKNFVPSGYWDVDDILHAYGPFIHSTVSTHVTDGASEFTVDVGAAKKIIVSRVSLDTRRVPFAFSDRLRPALAVFHSERGGFSYDLAGSDPQQFSSEKLILKVAGRL